MKTKLWKWDLSDRISRTGSSKEGYKQMRIYDNGEWQCFGNFKKRSSVPGRQRSKQAESNGSAYPLNYLSCLSFAKHVSLTGTFLYTFACDLSKQRLSYLHAHGIHLGFLLSHIFWFRGLGWVSESGPRFSFSRLKMRLAAQGKLDRNEMQAPGPTPDQLEEKH
jgi:hypothetical protein